LGIQIATKEAIDYVIHRNWQGQDLDLEDNTFETHVLAYNTKQNMTVLDMKRDDKVEKWTDPLYSKEFLRKFMDEKQNTSTHSHISWNNNANEMSPMAKACSLQYIHRNDQWQQQ
jgi:hypothetical protein